MHILIHQQNDPTNKFRHASESKTTKKETAMFFFIKFPPQINSYYNQQTSLITNLIKQVHTYKFTDVKTKNKTKLFYTIQSIYFS